MRILLTGVTSFTGAWFASSLVQAGHEVVCAVRGERAAYSGLRDQRLRNLDGQCGFAWDMAFGASAFLDLIENERFDVLCHHGAQVTNYKSPDFDSLSAAQDNCRSLTPVLAAFKRRGGTKVVLTGSVFEQDEGAGTRPLRAFSPYGLSKGLTSQMFRFHVQAAGLALGKFVIPNPFGPLEEPRFTDYLLRCWQQGAVARVGTPDYVRDNIPVSLLALFYADFVGALPDQGFHRLNPSFYVESQGAFAARFAREIGRRLAIETPLEFAVQADFSEPLIRINTDRPQIAPERWSEGAAWDELAGYYREKFQGA